MGINITISGDIGSGKSTIAKRLATRLGYEVFDAGAAFRQIAESKGYDVLGLNEAHLTEVDKALDDKITQMGREKSNTIFVSRTAWHFIPTAFKLYLAVDESVGASRVYNRSWTSEKYKDEIDAFYYSRERIAVEDARYKELYGFTREQQLKESNLVFYVGNLDPVTIEEFISTYAWSADTHRFACPTKSLIPTQCLKDFNTTVLDECIQQPCNAFQTFDGICVNYSGRIPMILDGHHRVVGMCKNGSEVFATENWEMNDYRKFMLSNRDYYDWVDMTGADVSAVMRKQEQQLIDDYCASHCSAFKEACNTGRRIASLAKSSGCSVVQVLEDLK